MMRPIHGVASGKALKIRRESYEYGNLTVRTTYGARDITRVAIMQLKLYFESKWYAYC